MIWIVGFNRPSRSWSSGGNVDDYPREHWDLYRVHSSDRTKAEAIAKERRRRQSLLSPRQLELLGTLIEVATIDEKVSTSASISLEPEEMRSAKALEKKGLIVIHEESDDAQLMFEALNFAKNRKQN